MSEQIWHQVTPNINDPDLAPPFEDSSCRRGDGVLLEPPSDDGPGFFRRHRLAIVITIVVVIVFIVILYVYFTRAPSHKQPPGPGKTGATTGGKAGATTGGTTGGTTGATTGGTSVPDGIDLTELKALRARRNLAKQTGAGAGASEASAAGPAGASEASARTSVPINNACANTQAPPRVSAPVLTPAPRPEQTNANAVQRHGDHGDHGDHGVHGDVKHELPVRNYSELGSAYPSEYSSAYSLVISPEVLTGVQRQHLSDPNRLHILPFKGNSGKTSSVIISEVEDVEADEADEGADEEVSEDAERIKSDAGEPSRANAEEQIGESELDNILSDLNAI